MRQGLWKVALLSAQIRLTIDPAINYVTGGTILPMLVLCDILIQFIPPLMLPLLPQILQSLGMLDSAASHHVALDLTGMTTVDPYIGNDELEIGDGKA